MKIVLVEDDHLQADWIRKELKQGLGDVNLMMIKSESEFHSRLEEIAKEQPAVIIMDVMLRWADPRPGLQLPDGGVMRSEKFHRAGLRCARLLQTRDDTSRVPIILYTVLEKSDLARDLESAPATVIHLEKDAQSGPLLDLVRQVTGYLEY